MFVLPPRRCASLLAGLLLACGPGPGGLTEGSGEDTSAGTGTGGTGVPTTGVVSSATSETPTSSGDETGEPPPPAFCPPGATPLRRLTRAQYENTLRDLFPGVVLPAFELPPDGVVEGFENIADVQDPGVSPLYAAAASAMAAAVLATDPQLTPCATANGGVDPIGCGHAYIEQLAPRVFRRPIDPSELQALFAGFDAVFAIEGFDPALQASIGELLASEAFFALLEPGGAPVMGQPGVLKLEGFALASRMSYFLWNSMPDAELTAAASEGGLDELAGIEAQVVRMLEDPRARAAFAHFGEQWLYLHHLGAGEPGDIPPDLRASMREEMLRLIAEVGLDGEHTLASLLTTPLAFPDAALAEVYGIAAPAEPFAATPLDPARRSGLLTRAGWLTIGTRGGDHSPFQRGRRLLDSLVCLQFPASPPGVPSLPGELPPEATTRERYDTILEQPVCAGCHLPAHRVGYGFEHHDALGQWQDAENGKPVDASGELFGVQEGDGAGPFADTATLAKMLAGSRSVHDCVTRKHYMYGLGRLLGEADSCELEGLQAQFFASGGDLRALLLAIVRSDGFRHRLAP